MKKWIFSAESIVILIIINILTITAAFQPDFLQSFEAVSYDYSMTKNRQLSNSINNIRVITIDKKSSEKLGQWPWDRAEIAKVLDILTTAKAKTIGLQFPLIGKRNIHNLTEFNKLKYYVQNTKDIKRKNSRELSTLLSKVEAELDTDGTLASSIYKAPNLVLAMVPEYFSTHSKSSNTRSNTISKAIIKGHIPSAVEEAITSVPAMLFPLDAFAKNASGIGHSYFLKDHDNTIRSQPLIIKYDNNFYPSFSLLLAANSLGIPFSSVRITDTGIKIGEKKISTNLKMQFYPAFYSQPAGQTTFKNYSFYDVANGFIPAKEFRNTTVIIGLSDIDLSNQFDTATHKMSSPFISANIINSIINSNYYSKPEWTETVEFMILASVILYLFFIIPHFSSTITALTTLILLVILAGINQFYLIVEHIRFNTLTAIFILASGYLLFTLYHYLTLGKRKFLAESADSVRMLVTVLQSQGQIDMAMEKLRSIPIVDNSILGLAYSLAQDYESKRQYGKAISTYNFIMQYNKNFRDTSERKIRAESIDGAVLLHSSSIITDVIDTMPKLGHYEIEKEIGKGAMGVVYLGRDCKINRTVAIKTLALAEEFQGNDLKDVTKRFFKEAEVAGKLNHPNIVTVYDAGQEHDLTYMAMEFLDGHDLTHYISAKKKPKVEWVLDIIWHIAGALDYAHESGVVHRDVKPANIMYLPATDTVKITDFGIARVTDSSTTKTGTALGTPSYMSPEQISGEKVKGSSDFFSLGVTMYELLTGELPFQGDSLAAMIYQITTKRHPNIAQRRKDIPTCVKTIVDKLLQKDPKKRYPDGVSVQEAIERCLNR